MIIESKDGLAPACRIAPDPKDSPRAGEAGRRRVDASIGPGTDLPLKEMAFA